MAKFGENNLTTAMTLSHLGSLMNHMGKYSQSEDFFNRSIKIRRAFLGNEHMDIGSSLMGMGSLLNKLKKHEKAIQSYEQALKIFNKHMGENNNYNQYVYSGLGYIYEDSGRITQALAAFEKSVSLIQKNSLESSKEAVAQANVAGMLRLLDQCDKAIAIFSKILPRLDSELPNVWVTPKAHWRYGKCLIQQQKFEQAELHIVQAVEQLTNIKGKSHEITLEAIAAAVDLYRVWKKVKLEQKYTAMLNQSDT